MMDVHPSRVVLKEISFSLSLDASYEDAPPVVHRTVWQCGYLPPLMSPIRPLNEIEHVHPALRS